MLGEMSSEAVRMLIIIFVVTIAFMIVWGILWIRSCNKLK
jgi:heme/copper-type cytochrome/quinol oxidase subunit 4